MAPDLAAPVPSAPLAPPSINLLRTLLQGTSTERFFEHYFAAEPVVVHGSAHWACSLATIDTCERLLANADVEVLLARDGRIFPGARPSVAAATKLFESGFSWVLRDVDRSDPGLAELGRNLASEIHGSLHLQLYRSPAGRYGFGWHFDAEEVFFVQTAGRKRLSLRRNGQHPSPLAERMPTWLKADDERTGVSEYLLEPGDFLYIPSGWWHHAEAVDDSVSISCGIRTPSALDALQLVVAELAQDQRWRKRLPAMGRASPYTEAERQRQWQRAFSELDAALHRRLCAPMLPTRVFATTGWWKPR